MSKSIVTQEQKEWIIKMYPLLGRKGLHKELNETFSLDLTYNQVVAFVKNNKIRSGRTGYFKKGHTPWTATVAGTGVLKGSPTSFKKGHKPHNYLPVGTEVFDRYGYILVKVAEENPYPSSKSGWWRHKHIVVWEKENGPVPSGYKIRFKDGDRTNPDITNLEIVSSLVHIQLNRLNYNNSEIEIKPVLKTIALLDEKISYCKK